MQDILKYFPELSDVQLERFRALELLYAEWNAQINVISRKDIDAFYERHVLHSLGIAKVMRFADGSKVLDIGTGGGFPGIPLAILYPNVHFTLVDSIGKKIKVVQEVSQALGLTNVSAYHKRAEEVKDKFDFVVSRAVTSMENFLPWCQNKFSITQRNPFPNGILYLKGGDLSEELKPIKKAFDIYDLSKFFDGDFFETKKVVYVKMT
jgi:16S rRNA (guanine527-N7)-methyltransferase